AVVSVVLAMIGPGTVSVDHLLELKVDGWSGLAVSAGGGVAASALYLLACYRPTGEVVALHRERRKPGLSRRERTS
ncbi:MAG: hypothetical protein ACRDQW_08400, partial [Haloechinothrix sp.]